MGNKRPRSWAREALRAVDVENGDFVLIRLGSPLGNVRVFDALVRQLGNTDREDCVVAIVEDFDDVAVLREEEMAEYGWYRNDGRGDGDKDVGGSGES